MPRWPEHPLIYEINTWVWLEELNRREGRTLTLASLPEAEWDRIAALGFDAVWLMGIWERSPEGIRISQANQGLQADFLKALPDFTERDNVGSPYCVRRYSVDTRFGGPDALAVARDRLSRRGLRLLLDFVPNHVAPDHPWVLEHPSYFIQGSEEDLESCPGSFWAAEGRVYACGRDPFFPAWPDVLQLNAFDPRLRSAAIETLCEIARHCDGVRCDMAMLPMNSVFEKTWGIRAGSKPETDYWPEVISAVRRKHPEFRFIAEAYWDLEWDLQQQGFDHCYDKRLYDRLEHDSAENVRLHLCADPAYQRKLLRFIENHDEPRAAAAFHEKHRAVALVSLTLPGARLIHEGQLDGRKVRLPVFLSRRPEEPTDRDLAAFYGKLLGVLRRIDLQDGSWCLCDRSGWEDNGSCLNLLAYCLRQRDCRFLVVVNLSDAPAQGLVRVPWHDLQGASCRLRDAFSDEIYERAGGDLLGQGLYVDLPAWKFHFLEWI